jgi:hypothetical protein
LVPANSDKSGGGPPHSKTLCATRRFLKYAKRLGLRQPSGALQAGEPSAKFPHEFLSANIKMNCYRIRNNKIQSPVRCGISEYAAPDGAWYFFGRVSTNMLRLRR